MQRGGWVMIPLLVLSVVGLGLIFERAWFWLRANHPGRTGRLHQIARHLRQGDRSSVRALVENDRTLYGRFVRQLLDEGADEATAAEAVERQRPGMERFMPTLGTIITAAPMLGILGTVTGIITAFDMLESGSPEQIGAGIAEALLTTAAGLAIALVVLFPFNAYRAQIDRTLGRLETLIAAARSTSRP